jgi:hypothetical protein
LRISIVCSGSAFLRFNSRISRAAAVVDALLDPSVVDLGLTQPLAQRLRVHPQPPATVQMAFRQGHSVWLATAWPAAPVTVPVL